MGLTFDEFRKLPEEEKRMRMGELSDHDRFLVRVCLLPPSGRVVESEPLTQEQIDSEAKFAEDLQDFLHNHFPRKNQ